MNKILHLLDQSYVLALFNKEILPRYPKFSAVKQIIILLIKNNIWISTYHVVIEYQTTFIDSKNKSKTLLIYCTAHSDEPRLNSFEALTFLWQNGFGRGNLTIPKPLFYLPDFYGKLQKTTTCIVPLESYDNTHDGTCPSSAYAIYGDDATAIVMYRVLGPFRAAMQAQAKQPADGVQPTSV